MVYTVFAQSIIVYIDINIFICLQRTRQESTLFLFISFFYNDDFTFVYIVMVFPSLIFFLPRATTKNDFLNASLQFDDQIIQLHISLHGCFSL